VAAINRVHDSTSSYKIVAAMTIISLLAILHQERPLQAAMPNSKPPIACVPSRPIAHPGESITVRAWIKGSSDSGVQDITWKASVGTIKTIKGTSQGKWSFPDNDASVSSEAPAVAQAFATHKTLGKLECQLQVYFVPAPIIMLGPKQPPILSGRTFLVGDKKEPEGYGLYTYVLFGVPPRDDTERERYLKVLESYLLVVRPIEQIEQYRTKDKLNITLIPLLKAPVVVERNLAGPKEARELAINLLEIYNYARAQAILADFGASTNTSGPYLASKRGLAKGSDRLWQDISHVYPDLVRRWTETFLILATQESSWTSQTLQILRLNMLNVIADAVTTGPIDGWIRVLSS
jgi:hypothetical protein